MNPRLQNLVLDVVARLPQNAMSRAVGRLARTKRPKRLARFAVATFAKAMSIDVSEAERPIEEYKSVHDFFVRRLRRGARRVDERPTTFVSPCDGVIGEYGVITGGELIQAKGRKYHARELIQDDASRFEGGWFITIYLSPRHYHRVHSPASGRVERADHIPGALLPVNMGSINKFDDVFCKNERFSSWLDTDKFGRVVVCMVGATCVGEMSAAYDDSVVTNNGSLDMRRVEYGKTGPKLNKGEELGTFHMGSTVVMLIEPKRVNAPELVAGSEVRMGEVILNAVKSKK